MRFPKQIAAVTVMFILLAAYPLWAYADSHVIMAVAGGLVLSIVNVLLGYAAIEYSMKKPYSMFVQVVLGGIVVRLIVMVSLLLVAILVFHFHIIAIVSSFFTSYVVFLVMEVLYLQNIQQQNTEMKEQQ